MTYQDAQAQWGNSTHSQNKVAYVSSGTEDELVSELGQQFFIKHLLSFNSFEDYLSEQSILSLPC